MAFVWYHFHYYFWLSICLCLTFFIKSFISEVDMEIFCWLVLNALRFAETVTELSNLSLLFFDFEVVSPLSACSYWSGPLFDKLILSRVAFLKKWSDFSFDFQFWGEITLLSNFKNSSGLEKKSSSKVPGIGLPQVSLFIYSLNKSKFSLFVKKFVQFVIELVALENGEASLYISKTGCLCFGNLFSTLCWFYIVFNKLLERK